MTAGLNATQAVQLLHDRHPHVIPGADGRVIDLEALHLEFFWLQCETCRLLDTRREKAVRRCLESVESCAIGGDPTVLSAVYEHFVQPHLIFHEGRRWVRERMPPVVGALFDRARHKVEAFEQELQQNQASDARGDQ